MWYSNLGRLNLKVLAAIASKIFLVTIANQLDSLWHTVLDDMSTLSFSEVPFDCQQQRQSEALQRTWACEAHFGPLSQAFIQMSLGAPVSQHIRKITGECLKQYFEELKSIVLICWKLKHTGNFELVPGPLIPPLAVWGLTHIRFCFDTRPCFGMIKAMWRMLL